MNRAFLTALTLPAPALVAALVAGPALAHHPLAGAPMETFAHGVMSGVGHPLLGFDHLFFILAVGVAALFTGRAVTAPLAFVAAMAAGVVISGGAELSFVEPMIAVSLLTLGALVARGAALALPVALAVFAGLGVFHGLAYGASLSGVEGGAATPVLIGYLLGLAATQWALAVGFGMAVSRLWNAATADAAPARISGALVAGVGAFLCLEVVEGAAFAALGLG